MNKISCDICIDLIPLVKDEVASDDSKNAVLQHIKSCEKCSKLYGEEINFEESDKKIVSKIKRGFTGIISLVIVLGVLIGIILSGDQYMFYNILIMPAIGALGYILLKKKSSYILLGVFVAIYLRWLYDSFAYAFTGNFMQAFIGPLWWAIIYVGFAALGVLIAFLLDFGFRREK